MKTGFRKSGPAGPGLKPSKGLVSRQPSFSCPSWQAAPAAERLVGQAPKTAGRSAGLLQSCPRTAQVLLRRKCSEDGSEDSSFWEQGSEDVAPEAGAQDLDVLHQEWKALQQRLGSNYAASCRPELHEPYRFSVEESIDMDDVPAPWAPLLPFPASPPSFSGSSPPKPPVQHAPHCSGNDGVEVWSVPKGRRDFLEGRLMWNDLNQVYVIIYVEGGADTEGIYSLRTDPESNGLPQDTIVAFESMTDAERYAGLLGAHMRAGYHCRLESEGTSLMPPDLDTPLSDWERTVKLRDGQWTVLENDVQPQDPCEGEFCSPDRTLDEARARLERLLAQESGDQF
ncbi:hypothetical protein WJX84_010377 [Apatococcus fuscideae]|uniref:Uncharacterized protein n=1 Tax=Apatococcus fuscideae TaxID=2026836 RepID=A0AAW1TA31_9CHLO